MKDNGRYIDLVMQSLPLQTKEFIVCVEIADHIREILVHCQDMFSGLQASL
jgi:hypothetical protein